MNKTYTIESFKKKTIAPVIKAEGYISRDNLDGSINYSSILSKLIQETGRLVDSYASDLFISWKCIMKDLRTIEENILTETGSQDEYSKSYLFGLRESGVDHAAFVLSRYNNSGAYGNYYGAEYRSIWRMDLSVRREDGHIEMSLYEVDKRI